MLAALALVPPLRTVAVMLTCPPAATVLGDTPLPLICRSALAGVVVPDRASSAALQSMRGLLRPLRQSLTWVPWLLRACLTSSTPADGLPWRSTAQQPATWGAAIEVPAIRS